MSHTILGQFGFLTAKISPEVSFDHRKITIIFSGSSTRSKYMSEPEMTTKVTMLVGPHILMEAMQCHIMIQLMTKHVLYGVIRYQI